MNRNRERVPRGWCDCGRGPRRRRGADTPCQECYEVEQSTANTHPAANGPATTVEPAHVSLRRLLDPHRVEVSYLECLDEIQSYVGSQSRFAVEHPQPIEPRRPIPLVSPFWRIVREYQAA